MLDLSSLDLRIFTNIEELRYGENPHQGAIFVSDPRADPGTVAYACGHKLQGKEMSLNNIVDADAALQCVRLFDEPACVIVKHANPCGVCVDESLEEAYDLAYLADKESAFGGVIAFNRQVDVATMSNILNNQLVEVIIAPGFDAGALDVCVRYPSVRILDCGLLSKPSMRIKSQSVSGGFLIQERDVRFATVDDLICKTDARPDEDQIMSMLFADKVAACAKSNSVVIASDGHAKGIGMGRPKRIKAFHDAVQNADDAAFSVEGCVLASEAFFPFRDVVDAAAKAGVAAIIQPGGSKRDQDSIDACNENGIAMVFTGIRHFKH